MNILWVATVLILGVVLIWVFGPREEIDHQVGIPELPDNINAYLADSESQFTDIRPRLEKTIFWADPLGKFRTPLSIIYLHGFSASRVEIFPVPEKVATELGANLFLTRLSGHGRTGGRLEQRSPKTGFRTRWKPSESATALV